MLSIIILSKNTSNLKTCVKEIRVHDPGVRVIVVDDGLEDRCEEVQYIPGEKPFVFSRNANIGIHAAGTDDVILLNDDAVLIHGSLLSLMESANKHHAILSASIRGAANNPEQQERGLKAGTRFIQSGYLAFVCVAIPRAVLNKIGLLDERFTTYGGEDIDYCHCARLARIPLGIDLQTVVDHGNILPSTFRRVKVPDIQPGLDLLRNKWVNGEQELAQTLSL